MAPELEQGKKYDGSAVDCFALGVILFMMLTGKQPFTNAGDYWHKKFLSDHVETCQRRKIDLDEDAMNLIKEMIAMKP